MVVPLRPRDPARLSDAQLSLWLRTAERLVREDPAAFTDFLGSLVEEWSDRTFGRQDREEGR